MTELDMETTEFSELINDALARELNDELVRHYGPLLSSADLIKVLNYPSANAYCQAAVRGTMPVPLLRIPNRRGKFALARDVAIWLSRQRRLATSRISPAEPLELSQ